MEEAIYLLICLLISSKYECDFVIVNSIELRKLQYNKTNQNLRIIYNYQIGRNFSIKAETNEFSPPFFIYVRRNEFI